MTQTGTKGFGQTATEVAYNALETLLGEMGETVSIKHDEEESEDEAAPAGEKKDAEKKESEKKEAEKKDG